MSLIETLAGGFSALRADSGDYGGAPAPWDDFWYSPIGIGSSTGMRITADTAKRIACVYACVAVITRMLASFPLGVYIEEANGGKSLARKHPLYNLLATRPNYRQTSFEFRQMMQGHLELRGNAYAEIIPGKRGAVEQLLPMHPDRVTVELLQSGRIRYRYNDPLSNQTRYLVQEEVFHLRNWSDDGVAGQSTVAIGADTFGVALAAQEYSARFFQNDARPGGILEGGNFKTKADEELFRESWQKSQTRSNRHKTAVLPTGMTYKEIGVKPSDAQLLDARKFSRIEICSMFGVPPHLIGETEKTATYASVEQFNIMFATQCLWPRLVNWEKTIDCDFLELPYFSKFSMAALMRGDTAARYASYQIGIQNGWLSQNDVRLMEDLNPIAGGDQYWRPLNWGSLTDSTVPATATAAGGDTENPGAADPDQTLSPDPNATRARLELLAASAAERCVRKEVQAVRKMAEHEATAAEFDRFYTEHAEFCAEVLRLNFSEAWSYCRVHRDALNGNANGDRLQLIDHWARTGARDLASLAVTSRTGETVQ